MAFFGLLKNNWEHPINMHQPTQKMADWIALDSYIHKIILTQFTLFFKLFKIRSLTDLKKEIFQVESFWHG